MIFLELFFSFFQIGLLSIGGGYAALPLIQARVVAAHGWLTLAEFTDVVTISQMTPGPIGINAATFVGVRIGGIWGAVVATVGFVTPSFFIMLALARLYIKYRDLRVMQGVLAVLRPAVVGLIAASGLSIVILTVWKGGTPSPDLSAIDFFAAALFAAGLFVLRKWKLNPIYVMLGAGLAGLIVFAAGALSRTIS